MSWPGFSNLFGAWFFLAMIPLIILYFLKLKRPRVEISSLALWQSVINDQRVNSPFQKFRRNILLLLQLLLLAMLILALMQPFLQSGAENAEYLPILVDCSASMGAVDQSDDKSRLALVKEQIQELIDNLHGDQKIALFSFASTGRRLTEFTNDRRVLIRALESLSPTDMPGRLDDVLRMAAAYTRTFDIENVIVMTDGNLPPKVDFELPFSLEIRRLETGGPNMGITEMSARRTATDEWEVFVRVAGSTKDLRGGELQLFENGEKSAAEIVEVAADESQRLVFPVSSDQMRLLEARLVPAGFDSMKNDNSVWLTLPAVRPLKAWTSPGLYSWQHALRVLPQVEVESTGEKPPAPEYDLIVSDTEDVGDAAAPVQVFVGVIPGDLQSLVTVEEQVATVVDWNRTAPLLRHVQLGDVQIGEQPAYGQDVTTKDLEERGYEVLIDGNEGPLLIQRREGLKTSFWFLFHTDRSTLPYRLGFPIMAANAVETALKQASLSEVSAAATGVLPAISVDASREYKVKGPEGDEVVLQSSGSGLLSGASAAQVGRYDVFDGNDLVTSIGTGLLNPLETSLDSSAEIQFSEMKVETEADAVLESDRPLWWILALAAFFIMLLEWWYYQRGRGAVA
ncbi:MAG: BatA and WFA domain-containing protein [Planctomycetaceae bacterium]